ncbi:MAG TPA: helix-turn-helix domain-containing protein [Candidatus Acidoferrum sp.]|nr:helix-turn-helix domain-containing protein [Candidatus Acidoferrum sp.]
MMIGARLKEMRIEKNLSQGDIGKRTGLFRCYVSRVENGHTIPAVETLEKFARALEVPLYLLVYEGTERVIPIARSKQSKNAKVWGNARLESRQLQKLILQLAKMKDSDREFLMAMAVHVSRRGGLRKMKKAAA